MRLLIFKYFPRFMVGMCAMRINKWGEVKLRLVVGSVHITPTTDFKLAEVEFLNLFGFVLFPRIINIYTP
jgi:hypothetical protein